MNRIRGSLFSIYYSLYTAPEGSLVENDVRTLPEDFLAYHQATLSPYRGMRRPVTETDEYASAEACARTNR